MSGTSTTGLLMALDLSIDGPTVGPRRPGSPWMGWRGCRLGAILACVGLWIGWREASCGVQGSVAWAAGLGLPDVNLGNLELGCDEDGGACPFFLCLVWFVDLVPT